MDSLRGHFPGHEEAEDYADFDLGEDDAGHEPPPSPVGQDERRMQVRAYNFWASLLEDRQFPSIEDLDPRELHDFGPYSVLLDFSTGIENPAIQYLGDRLAEECGGTGAIHHLSDVPSRSLLSRITDHYMQILANQAPIDFIYGVINWKELADQKTTDDLMLEIEQALGGGLETLGAGLAAAQSPEAGVPAMPEWADGPVDAGSDGDEVFDLVDELEEDDADGIGVAWPEPAFGTAPTQQGFGTAADIDAAEPAGMELADWLASARELAQAAKGSEDRSRQALYAAIGRAYDFSIAATEAPADFQELVAESGLTAQDRAPMTPVVKLVFGADYDKTRLTEYASALSHAHRLGLPRGALASFLIEAPGGLKGVVNAERRLKREESGKGIDPRETPREALARKLRKLEHAPLSAVSPEGHEFTLLVARRLPSGEVVLLGEVCDDVALLERAARKLID